MKAIGFTGAILALFISFSAAATEVEYSSENAGSVSIINSQKFEFDKAKTDKNTNNDITFNGEATLNGILQVYWIPVSEKRKGLAMNFIPDEAALAELPKLRSGEHTYEARTIQLNAPKSYQQGDFYSEKKIKDLLKSQTKRIPENFFKYKERYIFLPAKITFKDLASETICDNRYYYANFVGVDSFSSKLTEQEILDKEKAITGCGQQAYNEYFTINSKHGKTIEIKSEPNSKSDTKTHLPNGAFILKLKTINNKWMEIQFDKPSDDNSSTPEKVEGFIYTPNLKLEFAN